MPIALFDLDYTLISVDSDHAWGEHLVSRGLVDGERYRRENDRYYADYRAGRLDMNAFILFALEPFARIPRERLLAERVDFVAQSIRPKVLPKAVELVDLHRGRGDELCIVTATNRFVTEPIAALFGVPHLLATELEERDGRYTGRAAGVPSFRQGKVDRVRAWMAGLGLDLKGSCFYSDSHNDLPLLEAVERPVAVDPDPQLLAAAKAKGWELLSLR